MSVSLVCCFWQIYKYFILFLCIKSCKFIILWNENYGEKEKTMAFGFPLLWLIQKFSIWRKLDEEVKRNIFGSCVCYSVKSMNEYIMNIIVAVLCHARIFYYYRQTWNLIIYQTLMWTPQACMDKTFKFTFHDNFMSNFAI